jgi:hypothetical protein
MNQMDALMRAQAQAQFDAARAGLPQEYYSPEMSMAAQPNMSPVNPAQPQGFQYQNPLANYQGLAPMQHNVADIQRGGGIIQPLQAQMSQPGTGMMGGQGDKKDSTSGLLEMLAKAMATGGAA